MQLQRRPQGVIKSSLFSRSLREFLSVWCNTRKTSSELISLQRSLLWEQYFKCISPMSSPRSSSLITQAGNSIKEIFFTISNVYLYLITCNVNVWLILEHIDNVFTYMSQSPSNSTSIAFSDVFITPRRRGVEIGWREKVAPDRSSFKVVLTTKRIKLRWLSKSQME